MEIQNRAFSGTLVGFLNMAFTLGETVIKVPILLHFWGNETYGVWLSLAALHGLIITLDTGHQQYVGNKLNLQYSQGGVDLAQSTLASGFKMATLLGGLETALAIGLVIFGVTGKMLGLAIDDPQRGWLGIALILYVAKWWLTGSIGGVVTKIYVTRGYYARGLLWGTWRQVLEFLILIACAVLGYGIFTTLMVIITLLSLNSLLIFRDLWRLFPEFRPWWSGGSWHEAFENISRSVVLTFNKIFDQSSVNGLILLVGSVLGSAMVPAFTTIRTVANIFTKATSIFVNPLSPDMARFHVTGNHTQLRSLFAASWLINGFLINLGLVASLFIIEPLYLIWTRGRLTFDWTVYLFIAFSVSLVNFGAPLFQYLQSINHLKALSAITISRGVIVFGGAALLIPLLGVTGAAIPLTVGELIASALLPLWYSLAIVGNRPRDLVPVFLAGGNVITVAAACGVAGFFPGARPVASLLGSAMLSLLAVLQWRVLPGEVKLRFHALIRDNPLYTRVVTSKELK